MRAFTPTPPMKAWMDWAEQFITQGTWFVMPLSTGGMGGPRGTYITPPPVPAEPTEPEQRAFYHNVLLPMADAVTRFNAARSAEWAAEDAFAQLWFQQQSSNAP